jgi:hypothetical protein
MNAPALHGRPPRDISGYEEAISERSSMLENFREDGVRPSRLKDIV